MTECIAAEVALGHMSGPFTHEEMHLIFGGHFRTIPVGLVEKDPIKGTLHLIQHFSKADQLGMSVNSQLDLDNFLTHWHSTYTMAGYVNFVSCLPFPHFATHMCSVLFYFILSVLP